MTSFYRKGLINKAKEMQNNMNIIQKDTIIQKIVQHKDYNNFFNINNANNKNTLNNEKSKSHNLSFKNNNNNNQPVKLNNKQLENLKFQKNSSTKRKFNFAKNLNPTHMQYNKGSFDSLNNAKRNKWKNNPPFNMNLNSNINNKHNILNEKNLIKNNNNNGAGNQKKKMGYSQINFYKSNSINLNLFPSINNVNGQRPNLNSISDNWMLYSHQQDQMYNDFIMNMVRNYNVKNYGNENFVQLLDLEYKRPEEKLKKGQNQLILERLQKKYETQMIKDKKQNMHRTGTGFYQNKNNKKDLDKVRHLSAQENMGDSFKGIINNNNKGNIKLEDKNTINNNKNMQRTTIDAGQSKENKIYNKTYNNGFNLKKNNKERKKKERIFFLKAIKYFNLKPNYFWVKNSKKRGKNKKIKNNRKSKSKSFDNHLLLLYESVVRKCTRKNLINIKKIYTKKDELKYNTDNSEVDEVKEYKKYEKKFKDKDSYYANFLRKKANSKEDLNNNSSDSENLDKMNKKEPKFMGIFDNDKPDYDNPNNNNNDENNKQNNNASEKQRFKFRTTANFYSKNNNNYNQGQNEKNMNNNNKTAEEDKNCKNNCNKEKENKFNIENIIKNVIENNKRAAAARSSTSFYNIGSHFMNNHMRSTKTNFFSQKDKRAGGGAGFTGTKDSNFTKEQANEGKFNKPNSLKLTLINPINWRKHEEIWENLVTLNMGLADLEKYLMPPNDTDILVSSYLKMNPRVINFCPLQKINTSNTKNENNNFISFMIDDNIQNPKQEMKKWKEAYKRVIFRWHPDKLFSALEDIKLKNEQQKNELKKKSSLIINSVNTLYKSIMEILNKILLAKNKNENENNV